MGKSVLDRQAHEDALDKIEAKMVALNDTRKNSGYAFACFSSFTAIRKLKQNLERFVN